MVGIGDRQRLRQSNVYLSRQINLGWRSEHFARMKILGGLTRLLPGLLLPLSKLPANEQRQ
jgi:hypothetical protein